MKFFKLQAGFGGEILSNYVDSPKVTLGKLTIIAEVMHPEKPRVEESVYESS
jgi:hypothetical protein